MSYKKLAGIYADPTVDFVFKRIFCNPQNKNATIGLLNSILKGYHTRILNVEFMNVEFPGMIADDRKCIVDVLCHDENGDKFVVEMQNVTHKHFRERMILYASSLILHEADKGHEYDYHIKPTFIIAILNETLSYDYEEGHDNEKYFTHYATTEVGGDSIMPSAPHYFFIELGRFKKESEAELSNEMENWLFLLKESKFFTEKPANFASDEAFNAYFQASLTAAFTKEERQNYELAMHNKTDLRLFEEETLEKGFALGLAEGKAEGLAEGEAKGKAEGLAEGEAKGKAETNAAIVAKMKESGLTVDQISSFTGLNVEEINKLNA